MKTLARICGSVMLLLAASCGTAHNWQELRTDPMTFGECYDGLLFVVQNGGFSVDTSASDRGLGTLQSRWRERVLDNRHPGRFRVLAEVLVDDGSDAQGWPIRYVIDQEEVKDLRHSMDPREEHWSRKGQDQEREILLGQKLARRLAPKAWAPQPAGRRSETPRNP